MCLSSAVYDSSTAEVDSVGFLAMLEKNAAVQAIFLRCDSKCAAKKEILCYYVHLVFSLSL